MYLAKNWRGARTLLTKAIRGRLADEVPQIVTLDRTLERWQHEILVCHTTGASNGPTEGLKSCVEKVKPCGHGFRRFEHRRLRVFLYAGGVIWPDRPTPSRIKTRHPYSDASSHIGRVRFTGRGCVAGGC